MIGKVKFQMATDQIGRITLDQPARRNALSQQMWRELKSAIDTASADPNLRILVVTGEGEHFAAGADISEFETAYATPEASEEVSHLIADAIDAVANFNRPTIAQIRGACVGGGAGIALACDIRIADETSKFAVTPSKLGLVYPFDDIRRLSQAVGVSAAKDILFSARLIQAQEAKEMGLINRLVEQHELDAVVRDYALSICELSGESARVTKTLFKLLENGQVIDTPETRKMFLDGFSSADFKEGYSAFMSKRKPDFS